MLKSKSRIALALALVIAAANTAPALAGSSASAVSKMSGSAWLQRMERLRADKAPAGTPLWVSVKVKNVDVPAHALTISHGAIPKIHMPAMTMTFPVADPTHLTMLHKGDPVKIEVANQNGTVQIIDFKMQH